MRHNTKLEVPLHSRVMFDQTMNHATLIVQVPNGDELKLDIIRTSVEPRLSHSRMEDPGAHLHNSYSFANADFSEAERRVVEFFSGSVVAGYPVASGVLHLSAIDVNNTKLRVVSIHKAALDQLLRFVPVGIRHAFQVYWEKERP